MTEIKSYSRTTSITGITIMKGKKKPPNTQTKMYVFFQLFDKVPC